MKRTLLVLILTLLVALPAFSQTPLSMTVHFIDIGQGESVLLEFSCGAMLIDAGAQNAAARTDQNIELVVAESDGHVYAADRQRQVIRKYLLR